MLCNLISPMQMLEGIEKITVSLLLSYVEKSKVAIVSEDLKDYPRRPGVLMMDEMLRKYI